MVVLRRRNTSPLWPLSALTSSCLLTSKRRSRARMTPRQKARRETGKKHLPWTSKRCRQTRRSPTESRNVTSPSQRSPTTPREGDERRRRGSWTTRARGETHTCPRSMKEMRRLFNRRPRHMKRRQNRWRQNKCMNDQGRDGRKTDERQGFEESTSPKKMFSQRVKPLQWRKSRGSLHTNPNPQDQNIVIKMET